MRKYLVVFVLFCLAGCRETSPQLRIDPRTSDTAAQTAPGGIREAMHNVKIVTGEPAVAEDKKTENVELPKDKPGAVAVKMEY